MSDDNIVRVPELGLTSQLINELRVVINHEKYDHLTVTELAGVLELIKLEYTVKWVNDG